MGSHFPLHATGKPPPQARAPRTGAKPRRERAQPEAAIQKAICDYIAAVAPTVLCYAVPNASRRTAGGRASNAVPGLRKGVFDLALVLPWYGMFAPRAAFIEVKTGKSELSDDQIAFRGALIQMGVPHVVARSIDDVRDAFAQWNVPTRECRA